MQGCSVMTDRLSDGLRPNVRTCLGRSLCYAKSMATPRITFCGYAEAHSSSAYPWYQQTSWHRRHIGKETVTIIGPARPGPTGTLAMTGMFVRGSIKGYTSSNHILSLRQVDAIGMCPYSFQARAALEVPYCGQRTTY